jgi:hypothetical protein
MIDFFYEQNCSMETHGPRQTADFSDRNLRSMDSCQVFLALALTDEDESALQEETATPTATSRRVSLKIPSGQPNPTAFS